MNENWLQKYEEVKDVLICPTDLETYFTSDEIAGQPLETMEIGNVSLPSGKIVVRDPLVDLNGNQSPYFIHAPKGDFPVTIAVVKSEDWGDRYAVVKVNLRKKSPLFTGKHWLELKNWKALLKMIISVLVWMQA